jgi:hypothetical protein
MKEPFKEGGRRAGRVAQVVEHWPGKFKALSSNPSTRRGRGGGYGSSVILKFWLVGHKCKKKEYTLSLSTHLNMLKTEEQNHKPLLQNTGMSEVSRDH